MKASSRHTLIALGVMMTFVALAARATPRAPRVEGPPPPIEDAGPIAQPIPPDAVVAEDEAELARLVADARGPRAVPGVLEPRR